MNKRHTYAVELLYGKSWSACFSHQEKGITAWAESDQKCYYDITPTQVRRILRTVAGWNTRTWITGGIVSIYIIKERAR